TRLYLVRDPCVRRLSRRRLAVLVRRVCLATYRSPHCQKRDWRDGHKRITLWWFFRHYPAETDPQPRLILLVLHLVPWGMRQTRFGLLLPSSTAAAAQG